ncbi:MAG TPA: hypothetical protein VH912_14750 [Streptosporangiaceae bacterium]
MDQTLVMVSRSQGVVRASSRYPPAGASYTPPNRPSHTPWISAMARK